MQLLTDEDQLMKTNGAPSPTTKQIRDAVEIIHHGVYDPEADAIAIAAAHATLGRALRHSEPPVRTWLTTYLDHDTTAHGPDAFRAAVNALARHFKLPPARQIPPIGVQGSLFD